MNISTFSEKALRKSFGIDVSAIDAGAAADVGVGAAWGRVAPGARSLTHQHDETEMWVIVAGSGELTVDGGHHLVAAGSVVRFDPFETHYVTNTGETDLLLVSFFWRDGRRAAEAAAPPVRRGFGRRPVFVFSSAPTPNGDLHLGHLAGPFFAADAYTRFQRMNGVDAWHLCGSDDFQSYVVAAAEREGGTPAETAAHYRGLIRKTLHAMDIDVHQFTATSADETYPDALRAFFGRLVAADQVRLEEGSALFDPISGKYLYEAGVTGTCPSCGERTGGNLCEGCCEPNSVADLIDPVSTASSATPRAGTVKRYSLALHELAGYVREHHQRGRVPASVKGLAGRLFHRPRVDVPLTHPAEWGVAPAESGTEGQVIWSWIDLAFSALHGIEALSRVTGVERRSAVPGADWKIVHFLGCDGSFFYPIVFPALYRAAYPDWEPDIDYHLNEFYLLQHSKFSTSRRHIVWGRDVLSPDTVDGWRLYLALTRPEGRRTNFDPGEFDAFVDERLATQWQGWLADLGERVDRRYHGKAPDAGSWTPEHTAFLTRLTERLAALTRSLGQDGFSLNQAAEALLGLVDDTRAFSRREAPAADLDPWRDEARTAIALELAAARLLATCGRPVMPRFAAALAEALGEPSATEWPRSVRLVPPGTAVGLSGRVFFGRKNPDSPLLPWLSTVVREVLRLPADEPLSDRSLVDLGMQSMQAVALQSELTDRLGADVPLTSLLDNQNVAELAESLARDLPEDVVRERREVTR